MPPRSCHRSRRPDGQRRAPGHRDGGGSNGRARARLKPGRDTFVASVAESLEDAVKYPFACPRYWAVYDANGDGPVGFAMISDGVPEATLAAMSILVGPYFLWRLLIDERYQRRGYGTAILDAVVDYVRGRGARTLLTTAQPGEGGPQPFYERHGFVPTGRIAEGEPVLELSIRD